MKRFFILNFSIIIVLCLILLSWFSWLEWNYQILNFIDLKSPIPITAKQTLRQYLISMEKGHYETAYKYLSRDSTIRHSYEEFVDRLKIGLTEYNLDLIWPIERTKERIRLGIAILGDPGTWSFRLIQENKKWKVAWERGTPYFTYPDNFACGISD